MGDGKRLSLVDQTSTQAFKKTYPRTWSRASGPWGVRRNVYFSGKMIEEIKREAARLGRTVSSLLKEAWELARDKISQESTARFPRGVYTETEAVLHPAAGRIRCPRKRRRS